MFGNRERPPGFRPEPLPANRRRTVCLVLAAAALILFVRKTDAFLNPQFWAEDGAVFFLQDYTLGPSAVWEPYAGYLHLFPRLVALVSGALLPYAALPHAYNYASLLLNLLVVAGLFSRRLELPGKPALALAIVLVPHLTNEVFLSLTNIQWVLAILLVATILKKPPGKAFGNLPLQWAADLGTVILCGLTGPFAVLFLPFFVWKRIRDRGLHATILLAAAATVAAVQLLTFAGHPPEATGPVIRQIAPYVEVAGVRCFGNLFLGKSLPHHVSPWALLALLIGLLACLLHRAAREGRQYPAAVLLGCGTIVVLATLYKFRSDPGTLVPSSAGPRYFFLFHVVVVWCLVLLMEKRNTWRRHLTLSLLGLALLSSLTSGFHSRPFIDYQWAARSAQIGQKDLVIPLNPKGWSMAVPANRDRH
ncbi:MAG: hypothetical protein KA419_00310 [Acidobacteria bacterium]|nr:hypothetical protein [Acidobacteriota bacterium]